MRVVQQDPGMKPVSIVLETVEELAVIAALVGTFVVPRVQRDAQELLGVGARVPDVAFTTGLYFQLVEIVENNRCLLR